jgi:hypothetical protein
VSVKQAVARELLACGSIYNRAATKELVEIYADCLAAYSPEQVTKAFRSHIADPDRGQFFPKPADLIAQLKTVPRVSRETSMHPAWIAERREESDRRLTGPQGVAGLVAKIGERGK